MVSFEKLDQAYRNARKQKRYRREVLAFSDNLDDNLLELREKALNGTLTFGPYRRHVVFSPKRRTVMALPFPSRVIQWAVYQELNPFYDKQMIEDSYACRVGRGSLQAALRLQYWLKLIEHKPGNWYSLKLDISKYFYRVDHEILLEILSRKIKDERIMSLIRQIVQSDTEKFGLPRWTSPDDIDLDDWLDYCGMPIGNLTSQLFANIYLNELDQYCKHVLHIKKYVRYMDDIIILAESKEIANNYKELIQEFLTDNLRLDLNKKTAVRPVATIEFVGYKISAHKMRLRKDTVKRIKNAFRGICERFFARELTVEEFQRRVASYKGMIQHCDNIKLRNRLNQIYIHEKEKAVGRTA